MRMLVVEDEPKIALDVSRALESAGYVVEVARDGEDAWFRGDTEDFSLVVLDLGLPKLDGLTVLKRWRGEGNRTPVLVLTARGSWTERVEGIDAGADDYLPKPFQMEELLARVRALVRRTSGEATSTLRAGSVALDLKQKRVSVDGIPLNLSPLEFRLINFLMHNRGRVVSQQELTEQLYNQDFERESNSIEVLIGRLRRKLKVDLIETRRGHGYVVPDESP
ncbi:MAG: response regulator transcription factor [Hyphomicrobiaceae bacterium]